MKDRVCLAVFVIGLLCFLGAHVIGFSSQESELPFSRGYYPMTARVVEVNRESDIVVIESMVGHLWVFEGAEDWQVGDGCSAIMYDNNTQDIGDDMIIMVRYFDWEPDRI